MKGFGIFLLVVAALAFLVGFNMNTSVASGIVGRVQNIGLMNDRQNIIILAGVLAVVGAIFVGFGSQSKQTEHSRKNHQDGTQPAANSTLAKLSELEHPPCEPDLMKDEYKIWLVKHYRIEKNEALGGLICDTKIFPDIYEALTYADTQYRELNAAKQNDELRRGELNKEKLEPLRFNVNENEI